MRHALDLYKEAGVPTDQFVGVPVFQAEGLTVTTQDMQYVPLFMAREDLDIAVQTAYAVRNERQIRALADRADKAAAEYGNARAAVAKAKDGKEKVRL